MSSIFFTPPADSIFAIILILWQSSFSSSPRRSRISCAVRVKDAAIKSKSSCTAKAISERSLSLMNGRERCMPGTLMLLCDETSPPFITVQWISVSVVESTLSSINPSSISILVPGITSFGSRLKETEHMELVPGTVRLVTVYLLPFFRVTGWSNSPVRISGPFVSSIRAIGRLSLARSFLTISA